MKKKLLAFSLILAGFFSTSCLQEDYSDCYRTYRLILSYEGDGTTEIFPTKINRVEMYVFDEANACVSTALLPAEDVAARSTRLPNLKPGDYRIICVGNTHDTGLENLDSRDYGKILFAANDYLAGKTVSGNDSLYYASVNWNVMGFDPTVAEETITAKFASSHYDIFVELINAPAYVGNPKIEIVGVSPYTDFENVAKGEAVDYVMETVDHGNRYITAANNIMRHKNHEDVYLKVSAEDGTVVANINFAEHIEKHKDYINPELHECLIPFQLKWDEPGPGGDDDICLDLVIDIPEWVVIEVNPEFGK